jgi:hypothetical protein
VNIGLYIVVIILFLNLKIRNRCICGIKIREESTPIMKELLTYSE